VAACREIFHETNIPGEDGYKPEEKAR
jgi:hypothetical protein